MTTECKHENLAYQFIEESHFNAELIDGVLHIKGESPDNSQAFFTTVKSEQAFCNDCYEPRPDFTRIEWD